MPTYYEIAEAARRRNSLTPGSDINYQYGPFGARGQSSAPVGWGEESSFIPGDYYVPPGLQQDPEFNPYQNEDANQFWYEEADPTKKYTSHAAALEVTGGDPEMERKVALLNYQAAEKKRGEQQKMAMAIMQEQRMREKNWLTARNQQASRVAQQQRYDAADRGREADARNNAIWKAGIADPENRETYLRQFTGTTAEINAFDLSMKRAAEKYDEADEAKSYRETSRMFESSKAAIGRGDYETYGGYGIKKGQLQPWQETELLGAARHRDRIAAQNARTGKANAGIMARMEARLMSPDLRYTVDAENKLKDEGGDWTADERMAFRRDRRNYDHRDRVKLDKAVKSYDDAFLASLAPGNYPTVTKNSSGEWVAIWEKGRTEGGKVVPEGHRWEDDLFQSAPEDRSGPTAEQIADRYNARREAYIKAQQARQERAAEKAAEIEARNLRGEAFRRRQKAARWGVDPDSPEYASLEADEAEAEAAITREWVAAHPYSAATERHYRENPELRGEAAIQRPEWDTEPVTALEPTVAEAAAADPTIPMTAEEEADYLKFLEETDAILKNRQAAATQTEVGGPPTILRPDTASTNMPPAVVAQTETNVPPAAVTPRPSPYNRDGDWHPAATLPFMEPGHDTTGLMGVTPQVWARLAGTVAVKIAEEYAEKNPGDDPMNEGTAMTLAIKRLMKTHYPLRD